MSFAARHVEPGAAPDHLVKLIGERTYFWKNVPQQPAHITPRVSTAVATKWWRDAPRKVG